MFKISYFFNKLYSFYTSQIENMTEKHVEKVSQSLTAKEKELLS